MTGVVLAPPSYNERGVFSYLEAHHTMIRPIPSSHASIEKVADKKQMNAYRTALRQDASCKKNAN